jgi:uncharacterized protein (DUF1697 family)
MKTKILKKISKKGISIITQREKEELNAEICKMEQEYQKRYKALEEQWEKDLRELIRSERKYNKLVYRLEKNIQEADKKFEKAKVEYVEDKITLAELSEIQGEYKALENLKREVK